MRMKSAGKIVLLLGGVMMMSFLLSCDGSDDYSKADTPLEEEKPQVSDINDSGCTGKTRANSSLSLVLKKEGNIVTCEINGINANCGVDYFDIQPEYAIGKNAPDSLFIDLTPVVPDEKDCVCPYNVSFTVRNISADSFFLSCWLYMGMVSFKESNQITLEFSYDVVTIDGLEYYLYKPGQQASLYVMPNGKVKDEEWRIPSLVSYEGQDYTIGAFNPDGFYGGAKITKLILPNSVFRVEWHKEFYNCFNGRFPKLETIEVEPNSHLLSSVDGVLYSCNKKVLYCFPGANKRTEYTVIDGVDIIGEYAFRDCSYLKTIRLPESVTTIRPFAFADSHNLEAIYIPGKLNRYNLYLAFMYMPSTVTLFVPDSEVGYFKTIYQGPVLSISSSGGSR